MAANLDEFKQKARAFSKKAAEQKIPTKFINEFISQRYQEYLMEIQLADNERERAAEEQGSWSLVDVDGDGTAEWVNTKTKTVDSTGYGTSNSGLEDLYQNGGDSAEVRTDANGNVISGGNAAGGGDPNAEVTSSGQQENGVNRYVIGQTDPSGEYSGGMSYAGSDTLPPGEYSYGQGADTSILSPAQKKSMQQPSGQSVGAATPQGQQKGSLVGNILLGAAAPGGNILSRILLGAAGGGGGNQQPQVQQPQVQTQAQPSRGKFDAYIQNAQPTAQQSVGAPAMSSNNQASNNYYDSVNRFRKYQ